MLVYHKRGYIEIVGRAAEMSRQNSVEEVKAPTEYTTNSGEVHVCTRGTILPCILMIVIVGDH